MSRRSQASLSENSPGLTAITATALANSEAFIADKWRVSTAE